MRRSILLLLQTATAVRRHHTIHAVRETVFRALSGNAVALLAINFCNSRQTASVLDTET